MGALIQMNKAQIKAKKRRKEERDNRKRSQIKLGIETGTTETLDEYFARGGGGPPRRK
jgi:hypothetical protein